LLPAGWNEIEVDWQAGAGTGSLTVSVNGAPDVGLTGVDNDEQRVDEVSLGYVGGSITTTSGSMDLDEFTSFR
jgi:precorrin-6B methylase 2